MKLRFMKPSNLALFFMYSLLSGCASNPDWFSSSGANRSQIEASALSSDLAPNINIVEIDSAVANRLSAFSIRDSFAGHLPAVVDSSFKVGAGDALEVSIWEAPPATLFGSFMLGSQNTVGATSHVVSLPEQVVTFEGYIQVPFVGRVQAAGRSPQQIQFDIERGLKGKANEPQVLVRVLRNVTSNVTVVGEVGQSMRIPLSSKSERLLDALAAAGGVRQPVNKMTVQITRGSQVLSMPLERVIQEPSQNVPLVPGDVITALFQPLSFTALGAVSKNAEVPFEAKGISLAEALGRAGGMDDNRADARGVFVFRFENPKALSDGIDIKSRTPEGKIPVVYRLDLKNPSSFLVAQDFPMRDKDLVYVSNAPAAELQKFLNMLTSSIYSASSLVNLSN